MIETSLVNIAAHLPRMASLQPHRMAVVFPHGRDKQGRVSYTHYTFRQLDRESDRLARGLASIGIGRGVRAVLMVPPSLDFFALTFALFKAGAVPVMVDPGMGIKNLGVCLKEAEPTAFIGITKAHLARMLFGWAKPTLKILVNVGAKLPGVALMLADIRNAGDSSGGPAIADTKAEDTAAILFTSGSTGVPKGAVYTHGIFAAQVDMIAREYGIEPGEVDLPTFPLFALFAPALGMTAIIPDMDATRPGSVDPTKILEAIENFGVTNMFGSPALLRRVGSYGASREIKIPTVRRVIAAGAPMPPSVLTSFCSMLEEGAQVFTGYGATESLPVASIGSDEILAETQYGTHAGKGVCVGRPVADMTVHIIRISDEPIPTWSDDLLVPAGTVGEITVTGRVVTREYYRRPESTALAKINDPANGKFYHRMGDLGYLDEQGRIWFCGRKAHRVETPNVILFTIPVEGVFNAHPEVLRTALVGVKHAGQTMPVLCVELKKEVVRPDHAKIIRELKDLGAAQPHTRGIETFLFHPEFPVDIRHNAKIFREKLAVWAERKLA